MKFVLLLIKLWCYYHHEFKDTKLQDFTFFILYRSSKLAIFVIEKLVIWIINLYSHRFMNIHARSLWLVLPMNIFFYK
jgi:hypothetical protein